MDANQVVVPGRKPHSDDWPLERVGRDLAIPALGEAPWGTHFCGFFADKRDLLDLTVPYFRAGLDANERCIWLARPPLEVDDMLMSRQVVCEGQSSSSSFFLRRIP
jgi:MEDS: MEthanogen/methylotroph, DcmR Sensory domain